MMHCLLDVLHSVGLVITIEMHMHDMQALVMLGGLRPNKRYLLNLFYNTIPHEVILKCTKCIYILVLEIAFTKLFKRFSSWSGVGGYYNRDFHNNTPENIRIWS